VELELELPVVVVRLVAVEVLVEEVHPEDAVEKYLINRPP